MKFANVGTLGVQSGKRDEVVALLTRPSADLEQAGCLLYEVGVNDDAPDTVFVAELWESQEAHQASLQLESVRAAIAEAMPLLSGEMSGFRFDVAGSPLSPADPASDTPPAHHSVNYLELTVSNLAASKQFYADVFGWSFTDYGPTYAGVTGSQGTEIGGLDASGSVRPAGGPLVILFSHDLEGSVRSVIAAGGRIVQEPYDFPGGRRFHFADPDGTELAVWALPE